jgi:RimJ/RimL family protein N-acetyltransferase
MTQPASALLDRLEGLGVRLYVADGRLRVVAARNTISGDVRQLIEAHRDELIALLHNRASEPHVRAAADADGVRLVTQRLLLRSLRIGDESDVLAYRGREDVYRFLDDEPMTWATVVPFVAELATRTRMDRDGDRTLLAVELDGRVIGDIALSRGPLRHAQGELGWVFHPDHSGRGYATEAAAAALRHGFEQLRLHRIAVRLNPRNTASVRVCERLGMRHEGLLRDEHWFKGDWADLAIYALLDHEWRRQH